MGATQKRVLAAIDDIAASTGLSADHEPAYANTGTVYLRRGWTTVTKVQYDFQSGGSATLWINTRAVIGGPGGTRISYADGETITEALDAVRAAVAAVEGEKHFILIAEGGGWPTHAIGPFDDEDTAEAFRVADKWRESWGSLATDPRDLAIDAPRTP